MPRTHRSFASPHVLSMPRLALVDAKAPLLETEPGDLIGLARRLADLIPVPNGRLAVDGVAAVAFGEFADEVVEGLAAAAQYDHELLRDALGPPVQVGINPPWRILLELAFERAVLVGGDPAPSRQQPRPVLVLC